MTFRNGFGVDVLFKKIDGFGNAVGGAEFTLYEDYNGAQNATAGKVVKITVNDAEANSVTSASAASGTVQIGDVCFKAPVGTWYMRETGNPDSTKYADNDNIYQLVIQDKDNIAIKRYDGTSAADIPDIAAYGIMNISKAERKTILRKINTSFAPLDGAVFEIFRYDRTKVSGTDISGNTAETFTSGTCGVYFIGDLPHGTYYVHETVIPSAYQATTSGGDGNWFVLTVNANGAGYTAADPATASALTNTLSAVSDKP